MCFGGKGKARERKEKTAASGEQQAKVGVLDVLIVYECMSEGKQNIYEKLYYYFVEK